MNFFLFLCCNIFTWTPALSFFTKVELQHYNVFVKPYGLDLVKLIPILSPSIMACLESNVQLQVCNSFNITSNTSSKDLKEMFEKCPTGQLGCFQNHTGPSFRRVLEHLDEVMKQLCSDQCWKKLALVSRTCIQKNTTGSMLTAEKNALQFISEVLDATCLASQSQGLTCAENLIRIILQHDGDPYEVCDVSSSLKAEPMNCSSACYQELQQFYKNLGCCVGSVRDMIACYNISTKGDSFGAIVEKSLDLCHLSPPKACKRVETHCPAMMPTVSTETNSKNSKTSHNAMKIAGICIAVLVFAVVLLILARFIYQRIKRKEKLHLEDYGYSRLKMMEDDLYNDFTDDSDFEGFVAM